jgi:thiamine-monophosphate kinase
LSGEADFIHRLRALATHPAARGLNDDAAVLEVGAETLVLTHDLLVEGVHFLASADPADVAWKLVAVNLSDLAAKGAEPLGVLLGFMLGEGDERFVEGLEEVLAHYGVPLLGGDTTSGGPPRAYSLTAIGRATHTPVPSRAGAQAGDALYLTGLLGAAMLGFEALKKDRARDGADAESTAFRRPLARLAEGQLLAPHVTAMMDISDGLLLDAARIARASGTCIEIDGAAVPLACPEERRQDALRWGDDYELLFTLPLGIEPPVAAWRVGTVRSASDAPILLDGNPLGEADGLGYQHD